MILPIYTYGTAVLRKVAEPIDKDYPGLKELISNMYDTMYHAEGVGLAAPQIGKASTKKFVEGIGWTFHGHEFVGSKMIKSIFKRLKLPLGQEQKYVEKLVRMHALDCISVPRCNIQTKGRTFCLFPQHSSNCPDSHLRKSTKRFLNNKDASKNSTNILQFSLNCAFHISILYN
jgi:hypothetical protein